MIVHITFTDGYFEYSKLFLESFKHFNGSNIKVVFTTTDLSVDQMERLGDVYSNLIIHNKPFDYGPICKALDLSEEEIKRLKTKVEYDHAMMKSELRTKWKMHVAAENRVKIDIPFVMDRYQSEDLIVHFDADMCVMQPLDILFRRLTESDFTVMYRPQLKIKCRRVWICLMGIKTNKQGRHFMEEWGKELDKIPLKEKPFAYGQTSCYNVYMRSLEDPKIAIGTIPLSWIADGIITDQEALAKKYAVDRQLPSKALVLSGHNAAVSKTKALSRMRGKFNDK